MTRPTHNNESDRARVSALDLCNNLHSAFCYSCISSVKFALPKAASDGRHPRRNAAHVAANQSHRKFPSPRPWTGLGTNVSFRRRRGCEIGTGGGLARTAAVHLCRVAPSIGRMPPCTVPMWRGAEHRPHAAARHCSHVGWRQASAHQPHCAVAGLSGSAMNMPCLPDVGATATGARPPAGLVAPARKGPWAFRDAPRGALCEPQWPGQPAVTSSA
jgi:hypothetical protein